jgi:hypothetical protein
MTVTRGVVALSIMLIAGPTASWAEQLTLPCKFEGSERPGAEREKDVNQIYIDTDLPAVELRVAQTLGTTDQIYFGFRNRQLRE